MSPRARWWSALAAAAAGLAALSFALRPPRLTLLNAALRVDYGWAAGAAALVAAVLLAAAALAAPPRWARGAMALAAALAAVLGASRLRYRLETRPDALFARDLTGATALAWTDVTHVDRGPDVLVIWGHGDAQVRVDTSRFAGDQRAALERALARRIMESTVPRP